MSIKQISALFILFSIGFTTETLAGRFGLKPLGNDNDANKRYQSSQRKKDTTGSTTRAPIHKIPDRAHTNKKGLPSNVHGRRTVSPSRRVSQRSTRRSSPSAAFSRRAALKNDVSPSRRVSQRSTRRSSPSAAFSRRAALKNARQMSRSRASRR